MAKVPSVADAKATTIVVKAVADTFSIAGSGRGAVFGPAQITQKGGQGVDFSGSGAVKAVAKP